MKKILIIFIFLLVFIIPFNVQAASKDSSSIGENVENKEEVEQLYNYMTKIKNEYEILQDMDVKNYVKKFIKSGDGNFSVEKLIKSLVSYGFKEIAVSIKLMSFLIIIALICALLTNLQKAFSNEKLSNIAYFACYSMIIIIMAKSFYMGVDLARTTIEKMTDFMMALMPVLTMLLASIGGFTEAAIMDPIIIGTITISAKIFSDFIIPLISITFVLQFVNNLSDDYKIDRLTSLLNQVALWSQGILMTVFIGIITIRGIASKTIDQVVAKTAKYAVDNFVPIVGKCLSDAIATVAGYSILLKSAFSSVGLIILIIIMIFPVLKILVTSLLYKLTAALVEPISDKRLVNCINSAGNSLILITSCLISVSVMFFILIAIVATAGKMAVGG